MDMPLRGTRDATWPLRRPAPSRPAINLRRVARRQLVLALDAWRAAADVVEVAGRDWTTAGTLQRAAAADTYFVALDHEEQAAADYERACETWWRAIR